MLWVNPLSTKLSNKGSRVKVQYQYNHIYIFICIYIYTHTHAHTRTHAHTHTHTYVHIYSGIVSKCYQTEFLEAHNDLILGTKQ